MKKYFYTIFASLACAVPAFAHVKWFVDEDVIEKTSHGVVPFFYLTSYEVYVWAGISVVVVLLFALLDRVIWSPKSLEQFGKKHEHAVFRFAEVILGLFLVSTGVLWRVILVPNFGVDSHVTLFLQWVEICTGLLFVFGLWKRLASIILIALIGVLGFVKGFETFTENIILLALSFVFFTRTFDKKSIWSAISKHGVEIVRIGTGVSLIVLAFTEKLMYPELAQTFLQNHHWNFMANLGFTWFTDNLFILSTGFAEMIFGVVFILGFTTRINTVLIACFFAVSVFTMLFGYGAWEVEDLVVYSAAVLLLVYGSGTQRFYHRIAPHSRLHRYWI